MDGMRVIPMAQGDFGKVSCPCRQQPDAVVIHAGEALCMEDGEWLGNGARLDGARLLAGWLKMMFSGTGSVSTSAGSPCPPLLPYCEAVNDSYNGKL